MVPNGSEIVKKLKLTLFLNTQNHFPEKILFHDFQQGCYQQNFVESFLGYYNCSFDARTETLFVRT